MPTDTFKKLSQEKKDKIIASAKKEFSRVSFEETSIKNIVQDAEIARGSFYQYFESKQDLLKYMLSDQIKRMDEVLKKSLIQTNGDIFEVFILIYDHSIGEFFNKENMCFYRKLFENLKASQDNIFSSKMMPEEGKGPFYKEEIFNLIDKSKLNIQNEKDIRLIIRMLYTITQKALVSNHKYNSEKEARNEYLRQIDFLKFGALKR